MKRVKPYYIISRIYSYLMQDIDYNLWAEYLHDIIVNENLQPKTILEVASGNGLLAESLSNILRGKFFISDLSKEMLLSGKNNFLKIVADMRQLPLNEKFDLIYCAFDSVNYLINKNSILSFFSEVNRLLDDNGLFLFDVSLEENSIGNADFFNRRGNIGEISFEQKSLYDAKTSIHSNEFFVEVNGRKYYEKHIQKIYPFYEYFSFLEKSNLFAVACYDAFTFINASEKSERAQFVVRKIK